MKTLPELVTALERLGYFDHAPPAEAGATRRAATQPGGVYASSTGRAFAFDLERAEFGGVAEFLGGLRPFLTGEGVDLGEVEQNLPPVPEEYREGWERIACPPLYLVTVGGKATPIWTFPELEDSDSNVWGLVAERVFRLVNDRLGEAGSEESAYAVGCGTETRLVFLRPPMFDLLADTDALDQDHRPRRVW